MPVVRRNAERKTEAMSPNCRCGDVRDYVVVKVEGCSPIAINCKLFQY